MIVRETRIELVVGDITKQAVDVIVNAANPTLLGGGGVDGAIHRAGGPAILDACRRIREERGECPPGDAVLTDAGDLPARYVAHAVGPIWRGGGEGEAALLASCHERSLALAAARGARTIAFPAISTGAYGYPVRSAAAAAVEAVVRFARRSTDFEEIRFVLFAPDDLETWAQATKEYEEGA